MAGYANRMAQLLQPGGRLAGIFLYGEESVRSLLDRSIYSTNLLNK
jgi:hypothetical protein